jgi:hypothetical protein
MVNLYSIVFLDSQVLFNYDLSILSDFSCQFLTYNRRNLRELCVWIEVLITFDRYLTICHPNKFKFFQSRLNLFKILLAITVLLCIVNFENFFYFVKNNYEYELNITQAVNLTNTIGTKTCGSNPLAFFISDIIAILLRTIIPCFLMAIFGLNLVINVQKTRRTVRLYLNATRQHANRSSRSRESYLTGSILRMNLIFFILNVPTGIAIIAIDVNNLYFENGEVEQDATKIIILNYLYQIAFQISNLYHSTIFFQFLAFNKLFYSEFMSIFGFKRRTSTSTNLTL